MGLTKYSRANPRPVLVLFHI